MLWRKKLSETLFKFLEGTIILSAISNSFRRMFLSQNQTNEEIAKLLNVKPYAKQKKMQKNLHKKQTNCNRLINSIYYLIF